MRAFLKHKLLSAALVAALLMQCAATAFAATPFVPEIYHLVSGETNEDGYIYPDYIADANGNRLVETCGVVRAADDLPSSYDLRDYGLVTSVKHQAGAGSCWAFGSIASLESNYIKQGYGTLADTDFSEAHLAWFAQRQRTEDTSDPTYGDGLNCERPFNTGGNWNRASATLLRGVGIELEQNVPWITTYDSNTLMQMAQPESARNASYARMWSVSAIRDNSAAALKRKIMQNGAAILAYFDDYNTTRTGYSSDRRSYYQTAQVGVTNHVVTVVGWDDNYSRTNFNANQRPTANGAWLVKGSWSTGWANAGYYWISYQDPSLGEFASFVAAPVDIYDHIYQYDGAYPSIYFSIPNSGKMANVFTAQRNELLTHVGFYSPNATPVKATAEVYVAPEFFLYSGMHPTNGMTKVEAATTTVTGVEYGYTTIELASPTLLTEGQVFTIVLTLERSGSTVLIPAEGETVSNPADGVATYSGSIGDSFMGYSGYWFDTNAYGNGVDYNNVPLKAMTRNITQTDPTLELQTMPNKTTYLVGETFDSTGLSLTYTNEFGVAQTVTDGFSCSPAVLSAIGQQTVTVTYSGLSVSFDVTVEPYETSLALMSPPDKTTYLVGDMLNTAGLSLLYCNEYGDALEVSSGYTYDPISLSSIGTQAVTVSYKGHTVTFDVTVEPYEQTLTIVTRPNKMTYFVGETIDTTGLLLRYTDEYGAQQMVSEGYVCNPTTLRSIGVQTVTVTYNGVSAAFDVMALPHETTLALLSAPNKTTYLVGQTLDTTGLSLLYTDEYGDAVAVTTGFSCDTDVLSVIGTQIVTVTYADLSVTFDVTVEPYTPTLALQSEPDTTTYLVGRTLDTTGLSLLYTDEYGTAFTVTQGFTCDTDVLSEIGTTCVNVTYNDLSVSFDVTVEPYAPTLTLTSAPDKTTYFVRETLNLTGLELLYTDEYGAAIPVTQGYTCDVETLSELGTICIGVTYNELCVTFDVTVEPLEPTLTLQFAPEKTSYLVGDALDTTGLTLFYTDAYGDALIVTEGYVCTPGSFDSAGTQTVTVTYAGLSVTFDVTVKQTGLFLVADASGRAGETVDVAVQISDNPGIVATWLEIYYDPNVLTLESVQNGEIFGDSCFTPGNDYTALPFRALFVDSLGDNYTQNGVLVVFTFRVRTDARPGETTVELTYMENSTYDVDLNNVAFDVQDGVFTVHRTPGDVNADGMVDLRDVVMLRRYLAGWDVTVNLSNGDVDRQEGVNLKDVTHICRYLVGGYDETLL